MAYPKILLLTTDTAFAKEAKVALGGAVILSVTDNGEKALKVLTGKHGYTVVIADMTLKGMGGRAFLSTLREKEPTIRRIAVTDTPDFDLTIQLIKTADVSWLLTKPCTPGEIRQAVKDALSRYRKETIEHDSMKGAITGGVRMLVDILKLTTPEALARSKRIRARAQMLNRSLNCLSPQVMDMVIMLANFGCIGLPKPLLKKVEKGVDITKQDMQAFRVHPEISSRILQNVPRFTKITEIIRHQNTPCSKQPPLCSRILKVCQDMDQMVRNGSTTKKVLQHMRKRPEVYDPVVVKTLARLQAKTSKSQSTGVTVAELEPGMVMAKDMVTHDGTVLLRKGERLSEISHTRITTFNDLMKIQEPIHVEDTGLTPPSDLSE